LSVELLHRTSVRATDKSKIRHRRKPKGEIRPYRQGDMDSLCGLYAIINGLRVCCKRAKINSKIDWVDCFYLVLRQLEIEGKAISTMLNGMSTRMVVNCLRILAKHFAKKYKLEISCKFPWKSKKRLNARKALLLLEQAIGLPGTSAVLGIDGRNVQHWTAVKGLTERKILLADSSGLKSKNRSDFCFRKNLQLSRGRTYVVNGNALVVFVVAPMDG
jgi:hypothetical protein